VQVPLLLLRVDTPHIPHQDCQWDLGDIKVATRYLPVLYFMYMCLLTQRGVLLPVILSGVCMLPLLSAVYRGCVGSMSPPGG
jgi:hypothetical protein